MAYVQSHFKYTNIYKYKSTLGVELTYLKVAQVEKHCSSGIKIKPLQQALLVNISVKGRLISPLAIGSNALLPFNLFLGNILLPPQLL